MSLAGRDGSQPARQSKGHLKAIGSFSIAEPLLNPVGHGGFCSEMCRPTPTYGTPMSNA